MENRENKPAPTLITDNCGLITEEMFPSQFFNPKWTASLTLTLLLSVFSLPISAVAKNENNRQVDVEWTLRQDSAIPEQERLAQAQSTEERQAEALRLNREGLQLSSRGQLREALEKYQQALAIVREIGERQGEGVILNNLGLVYNNLGQYQEAIEYYQQALAIREAVGDQTGEGGTLNNLGGVYYSLGQYSEAIEYYQQALAIHQEVGDRKTEGITLWNLGGVYYSLRQYSKAIEYYQQALAIHQEVGERAGEGTTLNYLGLIHTHQGNYPKALESHQRALVIRREIGDRVGEGITFNNLGAIYRSLGQYPKALEYLQQALAICQELGDCTGEGSTLHNLGAVYDSLGQYAEAIEYYQRALAVSKETGNRARQGATLNNLGGVYKDRGQYAEAIEYYQQALAIAKEAGNRTRQGATLNNLGELYRNLGRYEAAIQHFQLALDIHIEVSDILGEGAVFSNLGNIYNDLGRYTKAIEFYQKALAIKREIGDLAGEGTTLNGLGLAYNRQGQYPKAIELLQKALAIKQEIGDRAGEGATLNNLGLVYGDQRQYPKAIKYYQQALVITQEIGDRAGEGVTLNNLGLVYLNQKQYTKAEQNLYAAITVSESLRSPELSDAEKISLFETQAHIYRLLQQTLIAQNKTDRALEISERGRARAFVELLAKQLNPQSDELPKIDPPSIEEIKQIAKTQNATLVQYSVLWDSLLIWVIQPTGKIDFRAVDLRKLDGSLADVTEVARLQAAGERGADNPNEFTSLIRGTQESLRGTLAVLPKDGIDNRINRLQQLHQILIAPIADLLPSNPEDRVIFIPHQELFYVPFPALTDTNDNYLIEKHTILTAPSIHVLQLTREHRQRIPGTFHETSLQGDRALIVGNPTMPRILDANGGSTQLSNLPGAEHEATEIAQMLNTEALLGENATETAIARRMKTARLIHFATHGLLGNFGYGIPGAIALAPSGNGTEGGSIFGDPNDGLLTSGEIVTMTQNNPLNAELVVLSACETGLGDLSGDGIIGLSRSLITAGVPSIMVSLWKVPDAATRELMTEFYTNRYEKKMDKAQALRQAMLDMMEGNYPDPTAWAAFTLMGEAE